MWSVRKRNQGWWISTSPPPHQSTHLSNQVKDAEALYWDGGRLGREDYSINLVSFVLDMPRVWDACWTNSIGNCIVKTGVQGKVRTGATYWESSACVWYLKAMRSTKGWVWIKRGYMSGPWIIRDGLWDRKEMGVLYHNDLSLRSHKKFLAHHGVQSRSASLEGLVTLLSIVLPTW